MERGEMNQYAESLRKNVSCTELIYKAVNDCYMGDYRYDFRAAVKEAVDQFGSERVSWVLANTVQRKDFDGRFTANNKEWANTFPIPDNRQNAYFMVETHPALLDAFIRYHREAAQLIKKPAEKKPSARGELHNDNGSLQPAKSKKALVKAEIEI